MTVFIFFVVPSTVCRVFQVDGDDALCPPSSLSDSLTCHPFSSFHFFCYLFLRQDLCSPGWPRICCVAEDDFEFITLLRLQSYHQIQFRWCWVSTSCLCMPSSALQADLQTLPPVFTLVSILCVWKCLACVCVCAPCVPSVCQDQKRRLDPLTEVTDNYSLPL